MNDTTTAIAPEVLDEKLLDVAVTDKPTVVKGQSRQVAGVFGSQSRAWTQGGNVD